MVDKLDKEPAERWDVTRAMLALLPSRFVPVLTFELWVLHPASGDR